MIDIRVHPDLWHQLLADDLSATQSDGSLLIDGHRLVADPAVPENCVVVGDGDPKSMADEIKRRARQEERNARYASGMAEVAATMASAMALAASSGSALPGPSPWPHKHGDHGRAERHGGTPADAEKLHKAAEKRARKAAKREENDRRTRAGKGGHDAAR